MSAWPLKLSDNLDLWLPSGEHALAVSDMFGNTLAFERVYFGKATKTFLSFSGGKPKVDSVLDLTLDERGPSEAAVRKVFLKGALATSKFSESPETRRLLPRSPVRCGNPSGKSIYRVK